MTFQGLVLTGFLRLISFLPLRLIMAAGVALGSLLYRIPNRRIRLARRNIELCFPELEPGRRELLARDCMRSMVQTFLEISWFWYRKPERIFGLIRNIHGRELFEQACAAGQGVLLAAPHLGSWELMAQYLPSQFETSIMYKRPDDPGVEQVIIRGRFVTARTCSGSGSPMKTRFESSCATLPNSCRAWGISLRLPEASPTTCCRIHRSWHETKVSKEVALSRRVSRRLAIEAGSSHAGMGTGREAMSSRRLGMTR